MLCLLGGVWVVSGDLWLSVLAGTPGIRGWRPGMPLSTLRCPGRPVIQPACPWCQGWAGLALGSGSCQGSLLGPLTVPRWAGQGLALAGRGCQNPEAGWTGLAGRLSGVTHISSRLVSAPHLALRASQRVAGAGAGGIIGMAVSVHGELSGFMKRKGVEGFSVKDIHIFPINITFITSLLQSLLRKDVGSSLAVGAVVQPCPWAHQGRVSEKAASWDDRRRMKSRRAGSCDARECLGIVQPVRTEIITLWNHLYTHFSSFLLETNMKHPSTFLLFHSESSSNIYRASLFRV